MTRLPRADRSLLVLAAAALLPLGLVLSLVATRPLAVAVDPRLALPPLQAPGEWFDSQRGVGTADVDYDGALAENAALQARTAALNPGLADLEWELLGPTNVGGRVVDLAVVPGRPQELWVATASGGVWRSGDMGTTFAPAWDPQLTQALGAMAATPDGTLLVGTGEANPGGGSVVYGGTGLYRSTDDGATWELAGMPDAGAFGRIVVDPSDGDTVYAAASGELFVDPTDPDATIDDRGLWRSTAAGEPGSWERIFPTQDILDDGLLANPVSTGAVDVAVHPTDPDRILVAMWDHHRTPEKRVYAGPGSSVWLTTDGGDTWSRVTDIALGEGDATRNTVDGGFYTPEEETGRIGLAFAPSDGDRVYAMIANTLDGTHGAWFSSTDAGETFTRSEPAGLAGNNSSYGWWFARIFVDPADADHLYAMGLELIESVDGGGRFIPHGNTTAGVLTGAQAIVHADQHAMAWSPDVPGLVYVGNDGGVYRSNAGGVAGTWVAGVQQGWTQHYSVDADTQTGEYVVSGLQDNLCQMTLGAETLQTGAWTKYGLCGDGIVTRVDPADPTTTFYCSQYGSCGKATLTAPNLLDYDQPDDRYGWLADIQFDPNDSQVIYTAGARLHRSTNGGADYTAISGDLSSVPFQQDPNEGYRLRGVVTTIATHPDGETVWVGTDEGRLWVTHAASTVRPSIEDGMQVNDDGWTLVDDGDPEDETDHDEEDDLGLPQRTWISSVAVDPADPTGNTAWVAYTGFRQADSTPRLFLTTDGGASFTPMSDGLPGAPINDVIVTPAGVFVATDTGVFALEDGSWWRVGDLPAVPVLELDHHEGLNVLTAATFGHGVRRVALPGGAGSGTIVGDVLAALGE